MYVFVNSFYLLNEESHNVPIFGFKRIYILIPVVSDCQFASLTNVPSNWLHVIHRLWECMITLVAFVLLFFTVGFQMSPQISCLRGCIITLIAFVWLFSTVIFQMGHQTPCMNEGIVTLSAFAWLFSTVCFQMCPQSTWIRAGIITLAAFVWLFSTVCF